MDNIQEILLFDTTCTYIVTQKQFERAMLNASQIMKGLRIKFICLFPFLPQWYLELTPDEKSLSVCQRLNNNCLLLYNFCIILINLCVAKPTNRIN